MAYGVPIEILRRKKRVCVLNTIVPTQKGFSYFILILFLDALGFSTKFSLIEALFKNDSNGIGTIFSLIKEDYTIYGREKQLPKNAASWEHKDIHIHYKILGKASRKNLSRKENF
jgi:hypothetical protein